ncbi:DUF4190 domain-containing protein [Arthrobacter methylotrophus]|uniref:DUF4190 domain-containing protein n=1 Tax=Arthrobacter methylotrophus TaxID=121291 RepID=A0ABV5UQ21_9MICC
MGFSNFLLPDGGPTVYLVAGVVVLCLVGWMLWRRLPKAAWFSLVPAAVVATVLPAWWTWAPWKVFPFPLSFYLGRQHRAFLIGGYDPSSFFLESLYTLVIVVVLAGILIAIAEGINWMATRVNAPVTSARVATQPQALYKQVGTTTEGAPIFEALGGQGLQPAGQNTFAVFALVFGIMGGIAAIPFGHIALNQINRTGERGRGMAIAGLILGYGAVALVVVLFILVRMSIH